MNIKEKISKISQSLYIKNFIYGMGAMLKQYGTIFAISTIVPSFYITITYNFVIDLAIIKLLDNSFSMSFCSLLVTVGIYVFEIAISYVLLMFVYNQFAHVITQTKLSYQAMKLEELRKNSNINTESDSDMIDHNRAIEFIKNSTYGIYKKSEAIKNGTLKELGGVTVIEQNILTAFKGEMKVYKPTTEENLNSKKEVMIYNKILREYTSKYGYFLNNNLCYEHPYDVSKIKIDKNNLNKFLTEKESELEMIFETQSLKKLPVLEED